MDIYKSEGIYPEIELNPLICLGEVAFTTPLFEVKVVQFTVSNQPWNNKYFFLNVLPHLGLMLGLG